MNKYVKAFREAIEQLNLKDKDYDGIYYALAEIQDINHILFKFADPKLFEEFLSKFKEMYSDLVSCTCIIYRHLHKINMFNKCKSFENLSKDEIVKLSFLYLELNTTLIDKPEELSTKIDNIMKILAK